MDTGKIIAFGASAFLCAMVFLAYAVNAWGQIRGTFHYIPPESLIELFKYVIFALSGVGSAGLLVSGVVAFRAITDKKKE